MIKAIAKILVAVLFFWLIAGNSITGFNDSYEEKFCKSYAKWNKYAWGVRNKNPETWEGIATSEYSNLQDIVASDSPSDSNYITKIANQWFTDSANLDYSSGRVMAAILLVECEKYGVKIEEKYLE
jgi:hypothetical protein